MKKELLEYLVRHCVREVLSQVKLNESKHRDGEGNVYDNRPKDYDNEKVVCEKEPSSTGGNGFKPMGRFKPTGKYAEGVNEGDPDIKGAAAPPEDGQGTADQPEIPKDKDTTPEEPSQPETPPMPDLKGIVFVNPKDKAKLQKISLRATDDASIERELHQVGSRLAGSKVKVAISTARMVKDAIRNPNASTYLYLGKYDPNSEEIFLMADKSLQIAKDSSISPEEVTGTPVSTLPPQEFNPLTATPDEFTQRLAARGNPGQTPERGSGIDETMTKIIKKMVNEVLDKR